MHWLPTREHQDQFHTQLYFLHSCVHHLFTDYPTKTNTSVKLENINNCITDGHYVAPNWQVITYQKINARKCWQIGQQLYIVQLLRCIKENYPALVHKSFMIINCPLSQPPLLSCLIFFCCCFFFMQLS